LLVFSTPLLIGIVVAVSLAAVGLIAGLTIGLLTNAGVKNNDSCKVLAGQTTSLYGNYRFMGVTGSTNVCSSVGT
jgi:hypothetical protein